MVHSHLDEKRSLLRQELLEYFRAQNFEIVGVLESPGLPTPDAIENDGFGDQEMKRPDIIAYDESNKCSVVGIVRTGDNDFESDASLTEYNVFLDALDPHFGQPYRLYIIAPAERINELQSLITHYIHREYWYRITFVGSRKFRK